MVLCLLCSALLFERCTLWVPGRSMIPFSTWHSLGSRETTQARWVMSPIPSGHHLAHDRALLGLPGW